MDLLPITWKIWRSPRPLHLDCGTNLTELSIAYETWGTLNAARDNVVVILHALSGSSHAVANPGEAVRGWWEKAFEPGAPLGYDRHYVICANLLGGCYGTTGPSSINSATGRPYGTDFPPITINDTINGVRLLLEGLGLGPGNAGPLTLIGGSMGGMLVLEWAALYPDEVGSGIALCTPGKSYAQTIAFRSVQRHAIMNDPAWKGGHYELDQQPEAGLSLARQIGMITYRSDREFSVRFDRDVKDDRMHFNDGMFQVQSYISYQGEKFVTRFDANTYLYFSRAMDLYDLGNGCESFVEGVLRIRCPILFISFSSDFLCPPYQSGAVSDILVKEGRPVEHITVPTMHGHDGFLIETATINQAIRERPLE